MEEFILNFHFLRPWFLLLLILPIFFYWKFFRGINNKSSWETVCDKKLLDFLLIRGSSKQRKAIVYLALCGLIGAILSLAGPSWQKKEVPSLNPENPIMILLNMSSDMSVRDLTPNRLARAKFEISDLLKLLHNVQTGMIVYSKEPFLISPITDDVKLLQNLLPAIESNIMPANGDRLDRAIALAIEKFKNAGYKNGNIIIFTSDVGERFDLALEEAQKAKADDYKISVAAVTTETPEKLKLIAQNGGGIYINVSAGDFDIEKIVSEINANISDELKISENLRSSWQDFGYYLIFIPLLCCLYFFRKGIAVIAFILFGTTQAQAGFFLNNNQEGLKAFNNQDYLSASQKFEDSHWKGSALYKAGDFEKAYQQFSLGKDTTALYNQGNALAKSGKTEEAIKKYEEVLKLEPKNEDAQFNLDYLKQQQEQNQQQQQDKQEQNQNQKDNKEEQQNQQSQSSEQQQNDDKPNQNPQDNQQNQDKQQQNQPQDGEQNQQESQDRNQSQSSSDSEQNKDKQPNQPNEQESSMSGDKRESEQQQREEENKKAVGELQKGDEETKYDEQVQARAQQFRDIPEDTGGLLRAFIKKEYMKNRYKE